MASAGAGGRRSDDRLTIDQLAASAGTTTRRVRSFQTLGLLPSPELRGRTGLYGPAHEDRLFAILRLQEQGFSLESLGVLFDALAAGRSLSDVLGLDDASGASGARADVGDEAERYGFAELLAPRPVSTARRRRPLLSVVPTTLWDESRAS